MNKRQTGARPIPRRAISDTTLRRFTGYNLKLAFTALSDDLHGILGGHQLRLTTFSALALIADNADIAQGELAQALRIERSSAVVVVDDLEDRELITRNRVPGDRRSYALRITLKGRRLLSRLEKEIGAHEARMFRNLTASERAILIDLLNRVEAAGDPAG